MAKLSGEKEYIPYLYILPTLILLTTITIYPCIHAIYLAFTDYNPMFRECNFIGLRNFVELITEPIFSTAFWNNVIWTIGIVGAEFILGLFTALLLHQDFPGRTLCRGLVLFPWVIPWVVGGVLWRSIYHPTVGVLNYILTKLGIIHSDIAWFGGDYALFSLMIIMIWKMVPFMVVMLLAGLGAIPVQLYEAARIDGANKFQSLLYITLLLLKPIAGISILLSFIWVFKHFDIVYSTTQGGPVNATLLLSVMTYRNAFRYYRMGYAAAIGVFMFIILSGPVYFYVKQALKKVR